MVGLPPTIERAAAFAKAADRHLPAAVEAEVDQLHVTPHFGEHLTVCWLDFVHSADTVGYHGDPKQYI